VGLYDTLTALIVLYATFTLPHCILMLRSYYAATASPFPRAASWPA
jgi:ABC-type glycerol-3-phosphate transport system permease component